MSTVTAAFTENLFYVTQASVGREPILCNELLMRVMESSIAAARKRVPFERVGYLFLPEQIALLLAPIGTASLDRIMQQVRQRFQNEYGELLNMTDNTLLWCEEYEAKRVQNVEALALYLDELHLQPVRRGYVRAPEEWPYSSYALWRQRGIYPNGWGWAMEER